MHAHTVSENEIQDSELKDIQRMAEKQDSQNRLYLHYAVRKEDLELVNYLLSKGESALQKDKEGNTPLMLASKERFGKGYDIFIALLKSAQEEIKGYKDGRHCPKLITECSEKFSKPLLVRMEDYVQEVVERSKIAKFFSVIFGQDKTPERNKEQAEIHEYLYHAEKNRDYFALYNVLDRNWDVEESSLHRKLEAGKQDGKKLFPDYEHIMRYREVLAEYQKQKPLSLSQRMIKKVNENIIENKRLTKENTALRLENTQIKETLIIQEKKIDNLETQVNALSTNVQQLSELIISSNILPVNKKQPKKKEAQQPPSLWASFFETEEKPATQTKTRSTPSTLTSNRK